MLVRIDRATDERIQILIMKINQESICICTRAVFSFSIYQRQKNKRFSFINFRYRLLNPNFHENIAWIQSFFPNMFLTSVRISWRPALPSLLEVGSLSMSEPAFIFPSDRSSFYFFIGSMPLLPFWKSRNFFCIHFFCASALLSRIVPSSPGFGGVPLSLFVLLPVLLSVFLHRLHNSVFPHH